MSIHKHEPVSKESMNWSSPENTICETMRKAYHDIKDTTTAMMGWQEEQDASRLFRAMDKLREATAMAKAMTAKLTEYKRNWRQGFWDENDKFPKTIWKMPIDVLFLCWDDNANTMFRFWQCARYLGLNCVMFKGKYHPFGYPQQAPIHPSLSNTPISMAPITVMAPGIETLLYSARVVHLGASTFPMAAVNWNKLNVVVQHGGTVYRQNPDLCNSVFNPIAKNAIIQCPDLLGLGANNETWIYYPVDTIKLKPDFSPKGDVPVIGHFPSNPEVKGTELIEGVLGELAQEGYKFLYVGTTNRVKWLDNLKRMAMCDIIIEGCNAVQGDKVYGEWGNTALEASALGCAVVTHCLSQEKYQKEYKCGLGPLIANDRDELKFVLEDLLGCKTNIDVTKRKCREWVEKNHSIPATANRLWDKVYRNYFE